MKVCSLPLLTPLQQAKLIDDEDQVLRGSDTWSVGHSDIGSLACKWVLGYS